MKARKFMSHSHMYGSERKTYKFYHNSSSYGLLHEHRIAPKLYFVAMRACLFIIYAETK